MSARDCITEKEKGESSSSSQGTAQATVPVQYEETSVPVRSDPTKSHLSTCPEQPERRYSLSSRASNILDFDSPGMGHRGPRNWSPVRKWLIVAMLSLTNAISYVIDRLASIDLRNLPFKLHISSFFSNFQKELKAQKDNPQKD